MAVLTFRPGRYWALYNRVEVKLLNCVLNRAQAGTNWRDSVTLPWVTTNQLVVLCVSRWARCHFASTGSILSVIQYLGFVSFQRSLPFTYIHRLSNQRLKTSTSSSLPLVQTWSQYTTLHLVVIAWLIHVFRMDHSVMYSDYWTPTTRSVCLSLRLPLIHSANLTPAASIAVVTTTSWC